MRSPTIEITTLRVSSKNMHINIKNIINITSFNPKFPLPDPYYKHKKHIHKLKNLGPKHP